MGPPPRSRHARSTGSLKEVAATGDSPRTGTEYRQLICAVYSFACREATFALADNPALAAERRPEPEPTRLDFYSNAATRTSSASWRSSRARASASSSLIAVLAGSRWSPLATARASASTSSVRYDLGYLSDVPILYLALAVIGVPLAATAAGWLLAGREPSAIARTAIE